MALVCPSCSHPVEPVDRFCSECGHSLPLDLGGEHTLTGSLPGPIISSGSLIPVGFGRVAGLPLGQAVLVIAGGPGEGAHYVLAERSVTAGRAPDSDLFLDDVTVSRRHAFFRRVGESWEVEDAGSLNGTYVNRARVDRRTLAGGDEVRIGKYRFVFLVSDGPAT